MRFYKTHLKKIRISSRLILISLIFIACQEEKIAPRNYSARVGDKYLMEADVQQFINQRHGNADLKNEFIRGWIRKQILLQGARAEGISVDNEYLQLVEKANNDILINLFIEKHTNQLKESLPEDSIKQFYFDHHEQFILGSDLYLMNIVQFNYDFEAEEFLATKNNSWRKKFEYLIDNNIVAEEIKDLLLYEYELPSKKFYDGIKYLNPNEYSNIIYSEQNKFIVVQLIKKYETGSFAEYNVVKNLVRTAYIASKRQKMIDDLVESLYSDFEIEIK